MSRSRSNELSKARGARVARVAAIVREIHESFAVMVNKLARVVGDGFGDQLER